MGLRTFFVENKKATLRKRERVQNAAEPGASPDAHPCAFYKSSVENLYRILSTQGNPKLKSLNSVLHSVGLKLFLK